MNDDYQFCLRRKQLGMSFTKNVINSHLVRSRETMHDRYDIETKSVCQHVMLALLIPCEGNHRSPVDSTHKQQCEASLVFLLRAWTSSWTNSRVVGDLRRHDQLMRRHCHDMNETILTTVYYNINIMLKSSWEQTVKRHFLEKTCEDSVGNFRNMCWMLCLGHFTDV